MHRATRFLLAALGVLTTTAALAQTPAATPAQTPAASARAGAAADARAGGRRRRDRQPVRPRWNEVDLRRPLDQHRPATGALPALPGPARAACWSTACAFAARDRCLVAPVRRRQRRLARPALRRRLRAHRPVRRSRACGTRSRSSTASTRETPYTPTAARPWASTTRRSARFRTARPTRTRYIPQARPVRHARAARHRQRSTRA